VNASIGPQPADQVTGPGLADQVVGIPPAVTEETEAFWAAAAEGRLLAERCAGCGAESFPPYGVCRACRGRAVEPVEITGTGHVYSYTVNHQRWLPGLEVPYALVLVEFAEHPGVRVFGRVRGCAPEEVAIGMAVEVGFEPGPGGYAVPSFLAAAAGSGI
jgi:uncharacterized OB-fold protein